MIVTADEQGLAVRQVEIKFRCVRVVVRGCWSVETITTCVDAIANGRIVRDIPAGFVGQVTERYGIYSGRDSVCRKVSCIDLRDIQALKARRSSGWARRIARATRRLVTNNSLPYVLQWNDLQSLCRSRFTKTFVSKKEERAIVFDWSTD